MNFDSKTIYLTPELRKHSVNPIATILKTMVWILWIAGVILGIFLANVVSHSMALPILLITWVTAFFLGLFPYAFAEIISLLQQANNTGYRVETGSEVRSEAIAGSSSDKTEDNEFSTDFQISQKYEGVPFDIRRLKVFNRGGDQGAFTLLVEPKAAYIKLDAVMADLELQYNLGDPDYVESVVFSDFALNKEEGLLESLENPYCITRSKCGNISSISVTPKEYSIDGIKYVVDRDEYDMSSANAVDVFMTTVRSMSSSREVLEYAEKVTSRGSNVVSSELMDVLKTDAEIERLYGNHHTECIKKIESYFSRNMIITPNDENQTVIQDGAVFCRNCGTRVVRRESVFCPSCGTRLVR